MTNEERDAILAGLRLLQCALEGRGYPQVSPDDTDIGDILTNSGTHPGLTVEQIDTLCDKLQQ